MTIRKVPLVVMCLAILVENSVSISVCMPSGGNTTVLSRPRRFLDFMATTKVFFRANIKENIVTWGGIWAHASGYKANMNILNDNKGLRPFRRDTFDGVRYLLENHGFDGKACVLKAFCSATRRSGDDLTNGMLFKLLRHVFMLNDEDRRHFSYLKDENCEQFLGHHCPLTFNNISPYTDDL